MLLSGIRHCALLSIPSKSLDQLIETRPIIRTTDNASGCRTRGSSQTRADERPWVEKFLEGQEDSITGDRIDNFVSRCQSRSVRCPADWAGRLVENLPVQQSAA